jgi:hypothetical protein
LGSSVFPGQFINQVDPTVNSYTLISRLVKRVLTTFPVLPPSFLSCVSFGVHSCILPNTPICNLAGFLLMKYNMDIMGTYMDGIWDDTAIGAINLRDVSTPWQDTSEMPLIFFSECHRTSRPTAKDTSGGAYSYPRRRNDASSWPLLGSSKLMRGSSHITISGK